VKWKGHAVLAVNVDHERTEMWLEETDEFGMMFMSLVNAIDREPEFS